MTEASLLPTEELRRQFNKIGQRLTPRREQIWRLFERSPAGLTIAEAAELLAPRGIGQATVYRTVKAMQEIGYMKWVHNRDGEHRFVASRPEHCHLLVCRSCARAVESPDCDMATMEKLIAIRTGFQVEGHHLEFFGLCPDCAKKT